MSERADESDVATFDTEHEACISLFGRVCRELVERELLAVTNADRYPQTVLRTEISISACTAFSDA